MLKNWIRNVFRNMPKSVYFIIGNEFCERFSFYGMRAVLMLYMTQFLYLPRTDSKIVFHSFIALCYFMPVFGALLADILLGKFKTVLILSSVYAIGNILLAVSAIQPFHIPKFEFAVIALVIIGVGAGGIKPCVAAFGGDQFPVDEEEARQKFFALFYWSINAGAVISMFVTPLFRAEIQCFDGDCYPLAFGFPAILMILSTVIFVVGKPYYKFIPPGGSTVINFVKCTSHALVKKCKSKEKKQHWLEHADDKYDPLFISDCKAVWGLIFLFCPLPMFWALFDQQGSAWTMQSAQMDGRLGKVEIHPDQMDSLNSLFVITFIPLFTFGLYPLLGKFKLLRRPLQRMATGGFLAALAFALSGIIQLAIERELPFYPSPGYTDYVFINAMPCKLKIKYSAEEFILEEYGSFTEKAFPAGMLTGIIEMKDNQSLCATEKMHFEILGKSEQAYIIAVGMNSTQNLQYVQREERRNRDPKGNPLIRIVYMLPESDGHFIIKWNDKQQNLDATDSFGITDYIDVHSYKDVTICWGRDSVCKGLSQNFFPEKGGFYAVIYNQEQSEMKVKTIIKPDWLSMFWQIPQYMIMTAGEVMLSITGLAFAYSQAPISMKSVLQAVWMLTIAFGNVFVMIIEQIKYPLNVKRESHSFFAYTVIMFVDMIIFGVIAWFYKYITISTPETPREPQLETESEGENL